MISSNELTRLRATLLDIGASGASPSDRADAVLSALRRPMRFDVGSIVFRDPEQRRHVAVATTGPAAALRDYLARADADREVDDFGLNANRPPVLASEMPVPLDQISAWADHLLPAGFRGGLAAGLFTAAGRHVGLLILLSYDPARPTMFERDVIGTLSVLIAEAMDRTRDIASATQILATAAAGVVLTAGGNVLQLPGLPAGRLLDAGSPIVRTAASEQRRNWASPVIRFLAEDSDADGKDLVRVSTLCCERSDLDHLAAAVLLEPLGDVRGLTPFQLRVLGCLASGVDSVPTIAAAVGEPGWVVADALDHALHALRTTDPTVAAVRALRTGLRIPVSSAGDVDWLDMNMGRSADGAGASH